MARDTRRFDIHGPQMIADLRHDFPWMPDWQAAAFAGNAGGESAGFTDIIEDGALAKGQKGGTGWFQWTGFTANNPRRRNFETWLKRRGFRADSYEGNYSFLYRELLSTEARTLTRLRATKTLEEAVAVVCLVFERPDPTAAKRSMPTRVWWAKRALKLYRADPPKPTVWTAQPGSKTGPTVPVPVEVPEPKETGAKPVNPEGLLTGCKNFFASRVVWANILGTIALTPLGAKYLGGVDVNATAEAVSVVAAGLLNVASMYFRKTATQQIGTPKA